MRRSRTGAGAPIVITSAATSLDDQHDLRRRKYLVMMGIRVLCVIAAAITAPFSLWVALAFMVGGVVLPWCAVLIANDRPAQRSTAFVRYRPPGRQALPSAAALRQGSTSAGSTSAGSTSAGSTGPRTYPAGGVKAGAHDADVYVVQAPPATRGEQAPGATRAGGDR